MRARIRVKPSASRNQVGGCYPAPDGDRLVVAVTAPAVDGRANSAVQVVLAQALGVPKRDVAVVAGHTSRNKVVEVPPDCEQRLGSLLGQRPQTWRGDIG